MFFEAPISDRVSDVDPQRLRREQINILYRALPVTLLAIFIHAIALAMIQFSVVPVRQITIWLVAVSLLLVLRWYWHTAYARRDEYDTSNDNLWLRYNLIGVYLSGLVWGVAGIMLFPSGDLLHQMTLLFLVAAIAAGSSTTLSSYPIAIHLFLTLTLVPVVIRLFWEGGDSAILLAPIALLFYLLINISSSRVYSNILLALTSRLALEDALDNLRDSTMQNRLLLESVSEGILGTDEDGIITFANPAAVHMLGYNARELIGKPMHTMIHHYYRDGEVYVKEDCPLEKTLLEGREYHLTDEVFWSKDSTAIPVEYRSTPVLRDGRVNGAVITFTNISARKQAEAQLERQAFYDNLTGLPNRVLLYDRLEHAVVKARRHGQMGALLFLDLDQFKMINDTLGHASGDTLLKEMAARLRKAIRQEDTAARMGGDEFVVLLNGLPGQSDKAINIIRRIADNIHRKMSVPLNLNDHRLQVTSSIGIALFPLNNDDANSILMQADTAMYRAKESGRNGTQFFLPSMQLVAEERLAMQNDLRQAVSRNELLLHYQPQLDAQGLVVGAEALLRWQHPRQGVIPPQEFISIAEETGLILPVGNWVLNAGCDILRRYADPAAAEYLPCLAINVSPYQVRQPEFVEQVRKAIQLNAIEPGRLELELTENILMSDIEGVAAKMAELKQLGVRFSLDDFGTGYSSLGYLRHLPLDRLKIDQSFVRDILENASSLAIVGTIIDMAHHLNLEVIAEGVETQEQLAALKQKGCSQYQGFYFDKPMPETEFLQHLRDARLKKTENTLRK